MPPDDPLDPLNVHTPGPEPSVARTVITMIAAALGVLFVAWVGYLAFLGGIG